MARIGLTSGFELIPEGEYVFRIWDVEYDEEFGKMVIKLVTADGKKHQERFSLKDQDDQPNEKALNAFSYFAKTALNDFSREEIDEKELIGHYIRAEVVHTKQPNRKDPTKTITFANLGDKAPADGFDGAVSAPAPKPSQTASTPPVSAGSVDLDALLGM